MIPDFSEMLQALSDSNADFLVIGAHAMAVQGYVRATGDLDLWVRCDEESARRVYRALRRFGAPLHDLTEQDLAEPGVVFQIGVAPVRIDILTSVTGLSFDAAWDRRLLISIEGQVVPVLCKADLIANKQALGRPKDLADIAMLLQRSD